MSSSSMSSSSMSSSSAPPPKGIFSKFFSSYLYQVFVLFIKEASEQKELIWQISLHCCHILLAIKHGLFQKEETNGYPNLWFIYVLRYQRGTRYCWAWRQKWCKPYLHYFILKFLLANIFFLMQKKLYFIALSNLQFLNKLEKDDDLTSASYLHMLDLSQHLLSQTKRS